jgi:protein SCO1/2
MKRYIPMLIPVGILIALLVYFVQTGQSSTLYKQLPIVGNHKLDTVAIENGGMRIDTIFHSIPDFSFTNQNGQTFTQEGVEGKVYVCDYFFTTCPSICPIMTKQMDRIYDAWEDNPDVMILSHTVDPETDTPAQLKEYASKYNPDPSKWFFLTGEKEDLYTLARKGYLLDAAESFGGEEDFIHTQNFALIDKNRRIRGFYDGTDEKEVDQLITDISYLLME